MKLKKILPLLLLVIMAVVAISLRRCNATSDQPPVSKQLPKATTQKNTTKPASPADANSRGFDRNKELFFSKHARCRMQCRRISQEEVRDIQAKGKINYNKSKLDDPRGASYALEGVTPDGQTVRIIFAPKQKHVTVVTVIDLENEYACPSC